ncbi:putative ABC transporter ATP-binding protein YfiL [Alicyclobacillus contaminans]|uniref:ABC transporter ATP-binding protein n=1 Tax=Alicyclobacillus contaminans TaxID=392016 RepID=UPI00047AC50B|nr:ABC transporter ATP-binding protein [Alicyclobacillus contaminans]GMA51926.1 putative ABC transporter ATP-binding protein YfiL [Alicyclobacillus contaminans]
MDWVVRVEHLRKQYGKTVAVADVSFSVGNGSCFGLLGPNGAGKSTTMKILAGIVRPDGGQAEVFGLDAARRGADARRNVGYVPQEITLYDKLSAEDNLRFFGGVYGLRGAVLERRIRDVLETTGLSDRANSLVGGFSGGMKRRINIAAALLHQPKLLILDEPTVGIDPQSRNHIFGMIRALQQEGVTIIYSTHYMEEVEALCDHVAIVDQGRVIAAGSLQEVLLEHGRMTVYVEVDDFHPSQIAGVQHHTREGIGWRLETADAVGTMHHVLRWAEEHRAQVHALALERPSLESVFLALTGTSLRD